MTESPKAGLDDRHLLLFGTIIQTFAAHELLIARLMAHVLKTQAGPMLLLMHNLSFEEKRKTLLDLCRHCGMPLDQYDRVNGYLSFLLPFTRLRFDIVHSVWSAAPSLDAIQPDWILNPPRRVKPLHAEAGSLPGDFVEDEEEKLAFSLDELKEIAKGLADNLAKFSRYLADTGLIEKA
jgi:hypothetical protein